MSVWWAEFVGWMLLNRHRHLDAHRRREEGLGDQRLQEVDWTRRANQKEKVAHAQVTTEEPRNLRQGGKDLRHGRLIGTDWVVTRHLAPMRIETASRPLHLKPGRHHRPVDVQRQPRQPPALASLAPSASSSIPAALRYTLCVESVQPAPHRVYSRHTLQPTEPLHHRVRFQIAHMPDPTPARHHQRQQQQHRHRTVIAARKTARHRRTHELHQSKMAKVAVQ